MTEPRCHYCDENAEAQCGSCGRLYCREHGDEVCLRCLAPESAAPSPLAYRGAVVALVAGTLVTVFLLLSPPESKSKVDQGRPIATSTPAVLATATPTRPGAATPSRTASTAVTPPAETPTQAPPTAAATPAERSHTVAPGDTLSEIAARFGTTVDAILALNPGVSPEALRPGAVLRIPPAP